jgi:hypothetical protein
MAKLPWPTLALGALTAALGLASVLVMIRGTQAERLLATSAKAPPALAIELSPATSGADLAAIQSRPLLHASRVYYVPPPPDARPAAPPRPDYRLAGTLLVPGKPSVALLINQSGQGRRVRVGEVLDGWTVQSVVRQQVTFTWESERFDLTTAGASSAISAGLKRVPMARQRVTSTGTGVQTLGGTAGRTFGGAGGPDTPAFSGAQPSNQPRLYRPPPN